MSELTLEFDQKPASYLACAILSCTSYYIYGWMTDLAPKHKMREPFIFERFHMKQWLKQLRDDIRNKFFTTPSIPTKLLKAHNHERSQNGVIKLRIHHELQFAAEEHAQWMSDNEIISHKGAYSLSIGDRTRMYNGITVGENIARGYSTVESVMQNWMDSNDNRSNILRKQYVDCGIAMAGRYWCVIFGTPIIICDKKDLLGFEYYKPTEHISDPIYISK